MAQKPRRCHRSLNSREEKTAQRSRRGLIPGSSPGTGSVRLSPLKPFLRCPSQPRKDCTGRRRRGVRTSTSLGQLLVGCPDHRIADTAATDLERGGGLFTHRPRPTSRDLSDMARRPAGEAAGGSPYPASGSNRRPPRDPLVHALGGSPGGDVGTGDSGNVATDTPGTDVILSRRSVYAEFTRISRFLTILMGLVRIPPGCPMPSTRVAPVT